TTVSSQKLLESAGGAGYKRLSGAASLRAITRGTQRAALGSKQAAVSGHLGHGRSGVAAAGRNLARPKRRAPHRRAPALREPELPSISDGQEHAGHAGSRDQLVEGLFADAR